MSVPLATVPKEQVYSDGTPRADGPTCATCGKLGAWETHTGCDRADDGSLLVLLGRSTPR